MSTYYCPNCGKDIEREDFSKDKIFVKTLPVFDCPCCSKNIKPKYAGSFYFAFAIPLTMIGNSIQMDKIFKENAPFASVIILFTGLLFIFYYIFLSLLQGRKKRKYNLTKGASTNCVPQSQS